MFRQESCRVSGGESRERDEQVRVAAPIEVPIAHEALQCAGIMWPNRSGGKQADRKCVEVIERREMLRIPFRFILAISCCARRIKIDLRQTFGSGNGAVDIRNALRPRSKRSGPARTAHRRPGNPHRRHATRKRARI
ncbi:hypothetical protein [Burkholderia sp. MSMB1589WGS]|uniref:hypothetical protein n=1 Tax=Burkholderia sp. MSMB1589WGS TaxID=1636425 RepID=UPI0012E78CF4|nr:hypothetical protein [Burkholderia sp. MSMB1589WGS]